MTVRKSYLLLVPILLFLCIIVEAQGDFPSPYKIEKEGQYPSDLSTEHWQILEDPNGKLTFSQVTTDSISARFHHLDGYKIEFVNPKYKKPPVNVCWVRFRIVNAMPTEARIALPALDDYVDIYTKDSTSNWVHVRSGRYVPKSKRNGFKQAYGYYLPYTLSPGQQIWVYGRYENRVYGRAESDYLTSSLTKYAPSVSFMSDLYKYSYLDQEFQNAPELIDTFFFAVLIFAAIFYLLFYSVVKEKEYLFFSLFLLTYGLANFRLLPEFLFAEAPHLSDPFQLCCYISLYYFLIQFCRRTFKLRENYPGWNKFLKISSYASLSLMACLLLSFYFNLIELKFGLADFLAVLPASFWAFIFCADVWFLIKRNSLLYLKIIATLPAAVIYGPLSIYTTIAFFEAAATGKTRPSGLLSLYFDSGIPQLMCFGWLIVLFAWILFKRYGVALQQLANEAAEKERAAKERERERNALIEQQKLELETTVAERTNELQQTLIDLKSTQQQLIQREKLASLGELTAGIAHEIQNPLNFINNFSSVNKELLAEAKQELVEGKHSEAEAILSDIVLNEEKIIYHGKRADSIVKSMMEHSRTSTGEKQPTDLNGLADECLKLALHGFRTKGSMFTAILETHFDPFAGEINVVPQDIGRVLLNLFNNAFYSVQQKKQQLNGSFEPLISVSTRKESKAVVIVVKDNGTGIPQKVAEKVFQPFFTTKLTGEGTGLGLSLSYDIVTKGHGGNLSVLSREGEGSEFTVQLPA
jgi:signal transduction histidine kinase